MIAVALVTALADVDLAYFTYPVDAGIVTAAANYTAAVRETGRAVRTVVMSMAPAHPQHPSDLGRAQWLAEEVMTWGGLDVLILRVAAIFQENIVALHGDSIRRDNLLRNSFSDKPVGWISGSDAGEVAVTALLHPDLFDGPVCYPSGSESLNHHEVAEILSRGTRTSDQLRADLARNGGARSSSAFRRVIPAEWSTTRWPDISPTWAPRSLPGARHRSNSPS